MGPRNLPLVLLVAIQFAFLGCLDEGGGDAISKARVLGRDESVPKVPISAGWAELALPNGGGHNHKDLAMHKRLSTPNFEVVGWNPLITDYHGKAAGGYFCGDVSAKPDKKIAIVHSWTSDIALIILDITDPADPKKLGELAMANTHVYDLAVSPDQNYALLATSPLGTGPDSSQPPPINTPRAVTFRDECTGEERPVQGPEAGLPYASGTVLVDISNPRNPTITDFRFFPILGGHSVVAQEIGGRTIVLVTVSNLPGQINYYVFMGILPTPAGAKFEMLSVFRRPPTPDAQGVVAETVTFNHDGFMQKHPVTGANIAYLADGNYGLTILNIDDPRMPRMIGRWNDWNAVGGPHGSHFIHETLPIEGTWDGRHYTFMGEECTSRPPKTPSCLVYTMDTTDPAKPTLFSVWTFPHDMGSWGYPTFSLHYLALVERTFFVSSFHGGLWAMDVSTEAKLKTMPSIGAFLPDKDPPKGWAVNHNYLLTPVVADVIATGDGHLLIFDGTSGAYVLRFDATNAAPPPTPWAVPGQR